MKKTITRGIAALSALIMLVSFAGCLKFSNSLDISTPLTTGSNTGIQQPTSESETPSSLPVNTDTESSALPGEENTTGAQNGDPSVPGESITAVAPGESATGQNDTPSNGATAAMSVKDYVKSLGSTEYDILRTNNCQIVAVLESQGESNPMELSIGEDKLYIAAEMEGTQIGLYVEGKKTYIYLPKTKSYLKLSNTVAKLIGMDPSEFTSMAEDLGFDSLPELSTAESMQDVTLNGVACKRFLVRTADETTRVYLNGKKLVAIDYLNADGSVGSTMRFTSVTAGFPAMPPAGYSEIGYMEFMKQIMAEME